MNAGYTYYSTLWFNHCVQIAYMVRTEAVKFFECGRRSAQYVVAEMLLGYRIHGPHSGPYEKFTA